MLLLAGDVLGVLLEIRRGCVICAKRVRPACDDDRDAMLLTGSSEAMFGMLMQNQGILVVDAEAASRSCRRENRQRRVKENDTQRKRRFNVSSVTLERAGRQSPSKRGGTTRDGPQPLADSVLRRQQEIDAIVGAREQLSQKPAKECKLA